MSMTKFKGDYYALKLPDGEIKVHKMFSSADVDDQYKKPNVKVYGPYKASGWKEADDIADHHFNKKTSEA